MRLTVLPAPSSIPGTRTVATQSASAMTPMRMTVASTPQSTSAWFTNVRSRERIGKALDGMNWVKNSAITPVAGST